MGGSSAGGDGEMGLTPRGSCGGFYFFNSEKAGRGMSFGPSLSFGLSPWICSRRGLIPLSQPHSLPRVPCWCGVEPGVSQTPGHVGQLLVGGQRGDPKTALEFVYHPIPHDPVWHHPPCLGCRTRLRVYCQREKLLWASVSTAFTGVPF